MILLNILGTILKIIGILLLCILLLLLFVLLVLLFVPIRYRAQLARTGEDISVRAQVSYLFRLIRLPVDFENGRVRIRLSVFGVTLFSNEEGAKKRRRKKGKPKAVDRGAQESAPDPKNAAEITEKAGAAQADDMQNAADMPEVQTEPEAERPRGIFRMIDRLAKLCRRLAHKIKAFFEKIAAFAESIKNTLRNLREKFQAGEAKASDIKAKAQLILAFLRDEENKNGIKYAGKSILRLLKHVFPYKIEGDIVFATGSPYSLGQALSVLGMLYPLYGKNFSICADFASDAFRLEGCVRLKGRIRLISILRILWKLWMEGQLKRLLLNVKKLKQKLTAQA